MRALIQRVSRASVTVGDCVTGKIGKGMLVLVGFTHKDGEKEIAYISEKLAGLRIFEDSEGKMNLSIKETGGSILAVSQFTLYGSCEKGRRPSFTEAAEPALANRLYEDFVRYMAEKHGIETQTGVFGAMMDVELVNDGPVTFMLESR